MTNKDLNAYKNKVRAITQSIKIALEEIDRLFYSNVFFGNEKLMNKLRQYIIEQLEDAITDQHVFDIRSRYEH
jgi:hypothetical protein